MLTLFLAVGKRKLLFFFIKILQNIPNVLTNISHIIKISLKHRSPSVV